MDVRFTEEQEQLRASVRSFLEQEAPLEQVQRWADGDCAFPRDLWTRMAALGWLGIDLPETCGGAGLGCVELALVCEAFGRELTPAPFFTSSVLAAGVLRAADPGDAAGHLAALVAGESLPTLALLEALPRWGPEGVTLPARRDGSAWTLSGSKHFVLDADVCDSLLVVARSDDGPAEGIRLFLVPRSTPGVEVERISTHDRTRRVFRVQFCDVSVAQSLGADGSAWSHVERALVRARVALAAEMAGAAERVLELSVAYARQREQFGRPIGTFQAIQHQLADMLLKAEGARSAAYYGAWAVDADEPDADVAACMAKAYASEAFTRVAADAIQVHGGQGFTWEQAPQLYYKRAKFDEVLLGSPAWNRARVAGALLS